MTPFEAPFSIEAEEAALGSCLMDPSVFPTVRDRLRADYFFRETHRWLWQVMARLDGQGHTVDLLSVMEALGPKRLEEAGGVGWLTGLTLRVPSAVWVDQYVGIVRHYAARRQALAQAEQLAKAALDSELDEAGLVRAAYAAAGEIALTSPLRDPRAAADVAMSAYERFERRQAGTEPLGVPTPSKDLTRQLAGGYRAGDLIILAARPGMGKTSFATLSLRHGAALGFGGLMFSLEMSAEDLFDRLVAEQARVDLELIRTGRCHEAQFAAVSAAYSALQGLPLFVDDGGTLTPEGARATIARHKARHPDLALVVVDYAQRMSAASTSRRQERYQEVGEVSRQLKAAARDYEVAVLLLAQVGRKVEERADKHPMLSDLKESGDLEQDADIVIFIYRDDVYNPTSARPNVAELVVAKHRNGRLGAVEMHFQRDVGRWSDLERYCDEADARPVKGTGKGKILNWTQEVDF